MNLRRATIKGIISAFSGLILLPNKALACGSGNDDLIISIYVNKRHFKKFQTGNIKQFLNSEYKNSWSWSKNVIMSPPGNELYIVANYKVTPITVSYDKQYSEQEIYCSTIDLIYADEDSSFLHVISSVDFGKNAIPYYSSRIRMSSWLGKVYAVLTFRNIKTNKIIDIKVSHLPANLKAHSCNPLNFIYIDA